MENEHEVPRLGITICVDPPNDNKDQGPSPNGSLEWSPGQFALPNQQPVYQGYPQASLPQAIPRISTSYEDLQGSPNGVWDSRSPASSDSGWSNTSSPQVDQFDDFYDDGPDFLLDNRSYSSDVQYQEEFDIENFLRLGSPSDVVQSPENASSSEYFSGPEPHPYQMNPPFPNPFPSQSSQYTPPYNAGQGSPTFNLDFSASFSGVGVSNHEVSSMKLTHQRSSSDFLSVPPSPTLHRGNRSHSRGPGHRSTISEGSNMLLSPEMLSPDASIFCDLRGRGLSRAKSAPSSKTISISRGKSPYERPASQIDIAPRLDIPNFIGPISGPSTPELESPSPSSAKGIVATDAMVQASVRRRKREANYFCPQCGASFTTENSRKRHELSHSGEKPYVCTKEGCGQTFSNDDDRKRHENKSKKHAAP